MDEPAPEGLLGQWLAQRHAPAADAADTDPEAAQDAGSAPEAEPAPAGLGTLAAAGAVLEAFAAGTLEIEDPTPPDAEKPAPPITRVDAPTTPEEAPPTPGEPSLANAAAAAVLAAFDAPQATAAIPTTDPAPAPDRPAATETRSGPAAAVVAAFRTEAPPAQPVAHPDTPPAGQPATPPAATPTPRPVTSSLPSAAPAESAGASGQPTEEPAFPYEMAFRPRTGARTLAGALLLAGLAATAYAGWRAYQERTDVAVGIAATLAVVTGIVWAVRAGSSVTRLSLRGSRLEVVRHGTRLVFDLADPQTAVEVVGKPGRRGWKVVFPRRTMDPVVLDASMVDPHELTRAIAFHRAYQRVTPGRR